MSNTFGKRARGARAAIALAVFGGLIGQPWTALAADKPAGEKPKPAAKAKAPPPPAATVSDEPGANDPVEIAIRKAVAHLYKAQKGDNWEITPRRTEEEGYKVDGAQWGGLTAIAVYALLAAGESPQDPRLARAIAWLDKADVVGTYAMAMKLQIWNYIERPTEPQKAVIRKDATLLLGGVKTGAQNLGLYHYWLDPTMGDYDQSCSNYGVLGMWAAAQQNLEVPTKYWEVVDAAWRKKQQKDGGWSYHAATKEAPTTLSMTGAGVATLFITQDMVNEGKGGECKGNIEDKDIDRGLKWLADHYAKILEEKHPMYALYNMERCGTASGYKYFGTIDWYKAGAAHLVKAQAADGSWAESGNVPGTAWGLLFLVKGRAPIMMNKLEYSFGGGGSEKAGGAVANWNQRPRDVANLAHWTGRQLEKDLNWQIVNLRVNVDDLHDAPVLYMAGNQTLNLSREEKDKLKQYVEQGGMILGHADCNDLKFSQSFAKLGQELFPRYEFRELPPDHLIYSEHFNGKAWANRPPLRGLTNGARELMVLIPSTDPARYWQIRNFSSGQTKPMAELAANIYLYAADKSTLKSKFKGQTYIVKRDDRIKTIKTMNVARLEYNEFYDPEPGGWRRFANLMHNTRAIDLAVTPVKLGDGKLTGKDFPLAHLTGTWHFKLSEAQRKELKEYVNNGGTLVVDAAGGAVEFKESAETELAAVFGDAARSLAQPLPLEHRVYSVGGDKLAHATYRQYAKRLLSSGMSAPRLRGIEVSNRTAVFYSPEDLSVGLVGQSVDGIYGYDTDYANDLMQNITLMALGGPVPPKVAATKPAEPTAKPAPKPEEKKMEGGEKKPEKKPAETGEKKPTEKPAEKKPKA